VNIQRTLAALQQAVELAHRARHQHTLKYDSEIEQKNQQITVK
jgi:hypothetical protein